MLARLSGEDIGVRRPGSSFAASVANLNRIRHVPHLERADDRAYDLADVQALLGHKSPQTAARYAMNRTDIESPASGVNWLVAKMPAMRVANRLVRQ